MAVICPSGNTVEELKKSGLEVYHMPLNREYISFREISAASRSIVRLVENLLVSIFFGLAYAVYVCKDTRFMLFGL